MEVKINDISAVKKELNIIVSQDFVNEKFQAAYNKIGKTAKIKGFRPGKAPKHILKKTYKGAIIQELFSEIINETYYKAISDNNLWPITQPQITPKELAEDKAFEYSALIETKPEIKNPSYKELKLKKEKLIVAPTTIDKEIEYLRGQHATTTLIEDPEKKVENGNIVSINFEGFLEDNTPIEGGKAEGHSLEVGLNNFIPGFEEGLLGMKTNETKSLNLKFPDEYASEKLKGANARFEVKVTEIKTKVLPELNDEFAKLAGSDNMEALKDKITNDFKKFKEGNIEFNLRQDVSKNLLELNSFEVPPTIVSEQKKRLMDDAKMRLAHLGKENVEKYIAEQDAEFEKQAISNVKLFFLFEEIGKTENISISEKDLNEEFEKIAKTSPKKSHEIREHYKKHGLIEDLKYKIKEDRTYNLIISNSTVEEIEPEKEEKK